MSDTIDEHIIQMLRDKVSIAQRIINDPISNWI